jgi:hypothetical protein
MDRNKKDGTTMLAVPQVTPKTTDNTFLAENGNDLTNTKLEQLQEYVEMLAGQNTELNHELSDKNSLITSLIDNFAGGVGVFEVGKDKLTAKYLSHSFYKMFGVNVREVNAHNSDVLEFTAPGYRKSLMHQIRQTIASNTTTIGEHKFLNFKGGKEFFVQACISVEMPFCFNVSQAIRMPR